MAPGYSTKDAVGSKQNGAKVKMLYYTGKGLAGLQDSLKMTILRSAS